MALKHSGYARNARPPELAGVLVDLDAFKRHLVADQGGDDEMTAVRSGYVRRLVETEGLMRLLGHELMSRGIFTRKGRTRATFDAFLRAASTWDRLATRLGLDRRAKDVTETPAEWLQRTSRERDEADANNGDETPESSTEGEP